MSFNVLPFGSTPQPDDGAAVKPAQVAARAGASFADVVRVTCFLSSLDNLAANDALNEYIVHTGSVSAVARAAHPEPRGAVRHPRGNRSRRGVVV